MILPSFNDLIPEQLAVYEQAPTKSMLVVGPPGSGKTSMAIWRARFLAGLVEKSRVVLVTRNRLLAAVAGQLSYEDGGGPVVAMTMNSLISNDYWQRFKEYVPQYAPYQYVWGQILKEYEEAAATATIDHLIVDEGQNLPPEFFIWAVRFGANTVSVFADEDQATLGVGTKISDLQAAGFANVFPLVHNHRNTQPIVSLMEKFHMQRVLPPAKVSRREQFDPPRLVSVASWEGLADMVAARIANRAESIGVILFKKDEINYLAAQLRNRLGSTRVDSFTSDADQGTEANIRIRETGVTVISSESAIGLEFDTVFLQDISRSLPAVEPIQSRRMYMLSARARNNLVLIDGPTRLNTNQLTSLPNPPILAR